MTLNIKILIVALISLSIIHSEDQIISEEDNNEANQVLKNCVFHNPPLSVPLKINLWIAQRRIYIMNTLKPYEDKILSSQTQKGKTLNDFLIPIMDNIFAYANDVNCINAYIELEVENILLEYS